jgi:hypothetical protein
MVQKTSGLGAESVKAQTGLQVALSEQVQRNQQVSPWNSST